MSYTRAQWVTAFLNAVGNSSPSQQTINWVINWTAQEDNAVVQNKHNLLNTTLSLPGSHGGGAQGNIQYYVSFAQGVQANATVLKNGLYPELLRDLQTNNIQALCAGSQELKKEMAIWGTGYFSWFCNPPASYLLMQTYQGSVGGNTPIKPVGKQWYDYPYANDYGGPEPFGNYPKPDLNIPSPTGTPCTAPWPGIISGINSPSGAIPAWGAAITIRMDTPLNAIATHYAFLHMQPIPANLRVGQRVGVGDVLGYAGNALAQGAQKVSLGFALYAGDIYGFGSAWSYNGDQRLNPYPYLQKISKNGIAGSGNGLVSFTTSALQNIQLAPNASVTQLLVAIDEFGKVKNPFDTSQDNLPSITLAGATFEDPLAWSNAVGTHFFEDTAAIGFRLMLFIIGAILFYKILNQFVDTGKIVDAGKNIGMLAAGL